MMGIGISKEQSYADGGGRPVKTKKELRELDCGYYRSWVKESSPKHLKKSKVHNRT